MKLQLIGPLPPDPPAPLVSVTPDAAELRRRVEEREAQIAAANAPESNAPQPVTREEATNNPLRPSTFDEMIGQRKAVGLMRRVVQAAKDRGRQLDHVLLVGPSGTGKSTFSHVLANELGADCYQIAAPVAFDVLLALRTQMNDGDVLFVDEIHLQAIQERRGKDSITQPEVFFNLLEDHTITTARGVLAYPKITMIGATTDEGMLPEPFLNRFPLRPRLEAYTMDDLLTMAKWNAQRLGLVISDDAAAMFARASRGVPRQINSYVKNADLLTDDDIDAQLADEVLLDLNGVTLDGLTPDMQAMMRFLFLRGRRVNGKGEVIYQASVNSIATGIGKSRDSKAIALRVEPYLIEKGWVQVAHGGRVLTDAGVERAKELCHE